MRAWDCPLKTIVIACTKCGRRGQYPKAIFIELVGRSTPLPDALAIIAGDCPRTHNGSTNLHDRCQARYPDLENLGQMSFNKLIPGGPTGEVGLPVFLRPIQRGEFFHGNAPFGSKLRVVGKGRDED